MTTSLKHPTTVPKRSNVPDYVADRYELPPVPKTNGVARNAFARPTARRARWHRPYLLCLIISDLLCVMAASWTVISQLEINRVTSGFEGIVEFQVAAYAFMPLLWLLLLWGNGAYDRRVIGLGTDEFKRVFRATIAVAATVSFIAFGFQKAGGEGLSRGTVAFVILAAMTYIIAARLLARRVLYVVRRRGRMATYRMLLIGSLPETLFVYKVVARNPKAGLVPVAIHLSEHVPASRRSQAPVPVYYGRDLVDLVRELRADTIAVCGSAGAEPDELRRLAWQLEGTGIDLVVAPQLTDIAGPRVHIRPIEGLPLLHVEEPKLSGVAWLAKNTLDRVAAAIGLILLAPLFLLISLAISLTDRGPAFFRQLRVGHEGQLFKVWKFRTMYTDAEERKSKLEAQNETDGMLFKIRDDPRVTPVGRFLRASSIDELPQLINVLKGEMSLVGPRPLPAEDGDYLGDVRRRLLVRPGMTGLWQVSGRSDLNWDESVRLDLYYVDNWSLAYDLSILWRTVGVVLRRKGAY
ncbi:sugar transferase [Catellatospora bangladeshensis]|uniref:Polyprenyl glycosylphosphotransferase n=1 Tax=Catellatospora bangladeshensis TaxID=310355 RepID=A0A8J3JNV8_9ACTN|nr:sugar transferase [Catellatospora bangladeshensis]GIF81274.1 polyprenyl glycosylphosphotransferase [Catellatospora bangladeshensis]